MFLCCLQLAKENNGYYDVHNTNKDNFGTHFDFDIDSHVEGFLKTLNLECLVSEPTRFKNPEHPSWLVLALTKTLTKSKNATCFRFGVTRIFTQF